MNIPFTKMQSLGNDFVVIDATKTPIALNPDLIRQMGDRHTGIGFDQLLLIAASTRPGIDFEYRIFNNDGNEVAQCGNGARCVGQYIWSKGITAKPTIVLGTLERSLRINKKSGEHITVDMGKPEFEPNKIPFITPMRAIYYHLAVDDQSFKVGVVNLGNPHAVMVVEDIQQAPVQDLGPIIEQHTDFPARVNVGFMQCHDKNHISLRVFERGAGETLACGSGACAAVVIGRLQGLLEDSVQVKLPGGLLKVTWAGYDQPVFLSGPAETVFSGEYYL